jgi:TolB-like protein/cytochrome c-type biogenesis protein CcmH/NrfG
MAAPQNWGRKVFYLFEEFELDTDRRELYRATSPIPLEPKVFDLLLYLIRNRERVVSKDDLVADIWNARIVSESALTTCINAARMAIGDSGEAQRLIKTLPRKGIRFVGVVREEKGKPAARAAPEPSQPSLALPDKPSIAVLPFENLSGDPEQEYFADGMVEDIITALSRMRWLFVIARNSSFTYKGRAVDVREVGRELGVRYVLEGSVRKAGKRVRIAGQLIDASTGTNMWADRFEGQLADIFDLQDQVTASVVGAIAPKLEQAEIERAKRKPTENLDAYDHFLQGMACVHRWTREASEEALEHFAKAIKLDPDFAAAYGMAARCYAQRKGSGWTIEGPKETAEAERLARRAATLGRDDAVALSAAGMTLAFVVGDLDGGAGLIARALALNPNSAWGWLFSAWVKVWLGEPEVAIEQVAHAMRLSPSDPHVFNMQAAAASAHFFAGRYAEASSWAEAAVREQPNHLIGRCILAASGALGERLTAARSAILPLHQLKPTLRLSNLKELVPLKRSEDLARLAEGLRKAGLPE